MSHKNYFIFIFFITTLSALAQGDKKWRVIPSVTEWIEEVNNWPDSIYQQENLIIEFNYAKDSLFVATSWKEVNYYGSHPLEKKIIDKHIFIRGLEFKGERKADGYQGFWLVNLHFKKPFDYYLLENNRFGFIQCQFDGLYQARQMNTRFFLRHYQCIFNEININNPYNAVPLYFDDCTINVGLNLSAIYAVPSLYFARSSTPFLALNNKLDVVSIDSCEFDIGLFFNEANVQTSLEVINSRLNLLDIKGAELPSSNTYIPFENIENKLGLRLYRIRDYIPQLLHSNNRKALLDNLESKTYKAVGNNELQDKVSFDQLIASYYKLLNIYKIRGERESYNTAYVEMRNKMTARSKMLYEQTPNFNLYFDWKINVFTKAFSDYGTRPAKAIIIFFEVVLAFSVFYFFFPSTWNAANNEQMMKRLSYLSSYFTSNSGLSEMFEVETKDKYKNYEEFRAFMLTSQKELPVYFNMLSKPLYEISVARFNFTKRLLNKTEILNGKWAELPKKKKALTSAAVGIYLVLYLLYVLFIRALNAITLSLNAFSTLGFGEIPTKGLARYVAIIQGFIGWFLLSIFLVSLIGQILN